MASHRPLRIVPFKPIRLCMGAIRVFSGHAHLAVVAYRVDRAPADAVAGVWGVQEGLVCWIMRISGWVRVYYKLKDG
jgi:hypothetical protein